MCCWKRMGVCIVLYVCGLVLIQFQIHHKVNMNVLYIYFESNLGNCSLSGIENTSWSVPVDGHCHFYSDCWSTTVCTGNLETVTVASLPTRNHLTIPGLGKMEVWMMLLGKLLYHYFYSRHLPSVFRIQDCRRQSGWLMGGCDAG